MESIQAVLIQLIKSHRALLSARLSEIGLFPGQDGLIYHLSVSNGQTMSDLAEKLGIQPATLFTMVERMTKSGWVEKEKDPDDKRTSRIYLTPKGKKKVGQLSVVWQENEALLSAGFRKEEKKLLIAFLQQLNTNLKI
jgi:DNA-binding MarR family transcriptional regulator